MNIRNLSLVFTAVFALGMYGSDALALSKPKSSAADKRIQYVPYQSNNVVPLKTADGLVTTVSFEEGEEIQNYGAGFLQAWEFAAFGNQLFLKPKEDQGETNLVVVTNRRVYTFDVDYAQNLDDVTYRMIFTYPDTAAKKRKEREVAKELSKSSINPATLSPRETLTAGQPVANQPQYNWYYSMNFGDAITSKDLAPSAVFDDGRFTVMRFEPGTELPAVYTVRPEDGETIVKTHVDPSTNSIIIEETAREFRLRNGQAVVGIYNEGYGKNFLKTPDGTTVPGLKREWTERADHN